MEKRNRKIYKEVKQKLDELINREEKDAEEMKRSLSSMIRYVKKSRKSFR